MALKNDIFINVTGQETRVAVVENGQLQQLHIERSSEQSIVGNIYKGKVTRVLPGMQAAFVDIGQPKNAFLHRDDIANKVNNQQSINALLHAGQVLLVQVVTAPVRDKGARLKTELSLAGHCLVYLPESDRVGISQQLNEDRDRLITQVSAWQTKLQLTGGFIIRTAAGQVDGQVIENEMAALSSQWQMITAASKQSKATALVYSEPNIACRIVREFAAENIASITIDDQRVTDELQTYLKHSQAQLLAKIQCDDQVAVLFEQHNIEKQITVALSRRVALKSGGSLVFDETEAMSVVDVNTASFVGKKNQQKTILTTNLEAANEVARQICLRNLSGIIIVDFIDMSDQKDQQTVLAALSDVLENDRQNARVGTFSPLGLVEISRKRGSSSLSQLLSQSCPVCDGYGNVKTAMTTAYEIVRNIAEQNSKCNASAYSIIASHAVIDVLQSTPGNLLTSLCETKQCDVKLQVDRSLHPHQYEIVHS